MYTYTTYREYISCPTKVESKFYLLLNGIRGALHPPFLERGFVLGVNHRSEGHQLKFIVLKRDLIASHSVSKLEWKMAQTADFMYQEKGKKFKKKKESANKLK